MEWQFLSAFNKAPSVKYEVTKKLKLEGKICKIQIIGLSTGRYFKHFGVFFERGFTAEYCDLCVKD